MKILITGICGFVGSALARGITNRMPGATVWGMDNLSRQGSELNWAALRRRGIRVVHGDTRCACDFEQLPAVDWVIDAAANPTVMAGVDGKVSSLQLVESNLSGTIHTLEYAKTRSNGLILLSTSRVYSVASLLAIPLREDGDKFTVEKITSMPQGVSVDGLNEEFPTSAPVSLYGATKLASEALCLEYGSAFGFAVWVNRCGVLAGEGQFGRSDQGIISYWIHAHRAKRPLQFSGFGCRGLQVRDVLHPDDLATLLVAQMTRPAEAGPRVFNVGGGQANSTSLAQLANWCHARFGRQPISMDVKARPFDAPWVVMDFRLANRTFGWAPEKRLGQILEEIAVHAEENPAWLEVASGDLVQ